jgi:hypothetical protein
MEYGLRGMETEDVHRGFRPWSAERIQARSTNSVGSTMLKSISRRIKRLENLKFHQRPKSGPHLAAIMVERRRKHALTEGRKPAPPRPPGRLVVLRDCPITFADVLIQNRRRPEEPHPRSRNLWPMGRQNGVAND